MKVSIQYYLKVLLIISGFLLTSIGIIGIFLPLLPTTPFLLLAAVCFSKSSAKLNNWLLNAKYLGVFIRNYRYGRGINVRHKVISITFLWLCIGSTCILTSAWIVRIILLLVAVSVTTHIITLKTLKEDEITFSELDI